MTDIRGIFNDIDLEINSLISGIVKVTLEETVKDVAEFWANTIIDILVSKRLKPPLKKTTIERRKERNQNVLSPEVALIETGTWITFIEFRCKVSSDVGIVEVVVDDYDTSIGHTNDISPYKIAVLNEYGSLYIPARPIFATSELEVDGKLESVINQTWGKLSLNGVMDSKINAFLKFGLDSDSSGYFAIGRISHNGSTFQFGWDDA